MSRRFLLGLVLLLVLAGCKSDRTRSTPAGPTLPPMPPTPVGAAKILVAETGMHRVTAADLAQVGLDPAGLRPDNVSLSLGDSAVAFWIDPAGPELFFYGQASTSRYTPAAVYLIRWGGAAGVVMRERQLPAATGSAISTLDQMERWEENRSYVSRAAPRVGEPWFWQRLGPGAPAQLAFNLAAVEDGEGAVRISLWGATSDLNVNPDHRVLLTLNGVSLGPVEWDGETVITGTLTIQAGLLKSGENELDVTLPGDTGNLADLAYLDWIEIGYPASTRLRGGMLVLSGVAGDVELADASLLFDVSQPTVPERLVLPPNSSGKVAFYVDGPRSLVALATGGGLTPLDVELLRDANWSDPSHQADYVVLAPADLLPSLEPLAVARRAQGLKVALVSVEDVFDEFGAGARTPVAINAFLKLAYTDWTAPRLQYVLLVGEASYDYRNYLGLNPPQVVPPLLVPVTHGGETVSDSRLADLDGDGRPEVALGRWPVSSGDAVAGLVRRTLAYEGASATSDRALFVADGSEASFASMADRIIQRAGLGAAVPLVGVPGEAMVAEWNKGAWLVAYAGHGSLDLWGKTEILSQQAVAQLGASGRPPIAVHLTCLTGLFAHPEQTSLGETMLWSESGPVAIIAATSLTLPTDQEPFAISLLEALADPAVRTVGDALLRAQQSPSLSYRGGQEIIDTFNLLGDPALVVGRPG